jgi:RES domain-containing protein
MESFGGDTLAECLSEWEIFPEDESQGRQNAILDGIMGWDPRDGDQSASEDWQRESDRWFVNPLHERWPWFADHLKRSRRHIIDPDPTGEIVRPETWVPELIEEASSIRQITTHTRLFRGRLGSVTTAHDGRAPLPADQMGAPPARLARAGRANPEGIAFLYCALDAKTAIVETGRFPGAVVSLRPLRAKKTLRLADLRGRASALEPLGTPNLREEIHNRTLLGSLGDALGQPIHPEDSSVEYIPTQYLAEVILAAGYDGICFPSALNPKGANVVIFNPTDVRVSRSGRLFELGRAEYTVHPNPDSSRSRT